MWQSCDLTIHNDLKWTDRNNWKYYWNCTFNSDLCICKVPPLLDTQPWSKMEAFQSQSSPNWSIQRNKEVVICFFCLFVWFDSLRPSQQFFSYVWVEQVLRINVSCSRTQHSDIGEARTPLESSTLPLSHCAPCDFMVHQGSSGGKSPLPLFWGLCMSWRGKSFYLPVCLSVCLLACLSGWLSVTNLLSPWLKI